MATQHGRPVRALGILLLALTLAGCAVTGNGHLAAQAYERGQMEAARGAYLRYLQGNPNDAQAWFRLGNAYAEQDQLPEAEGAYRRALKLRPDYPEARHNLGLVYLQQGVSSLLSARRELPDVDPEAAATMRYLACLMETFMGHPAPPTCRNAAEAEQAVPSQ